MATTNSPSRSFELSTMFEQAAAQFRGLDTRQPGQWPILPKLGSWLLLAALVVGLGWFLLLSAKNDELEAERAKEPSLKSDYRGKLAQAVNLPELRKQKQQVEEYVTQLEKQLPGKAEMDALLSDINQAGIGRGLQFELFRPGSVSVKDYYAELPISVRVTGRYHDIGAFAADVANLSRIVTLHDMTLSPSAGGAAAATSGLLAMDATARTYRYLDAAEVSAQAEQKKKAAAGGRK
jgi:type IV pilus assembly protein PilO